MCISTISNVFVSQTEAGAEGPEGGCRIMWGEEAKGVKSYNPPATPTSARIEVAAFTTIPVERVC